MFRRIVSLPVMLVFIFALASPQAAVADRSPGKKLVGTWEVTILSDVLPPALDTTVVHQDGTVSNWDPALGAGNGIWRRLGDSRYEVKFKTVVLFNNIFGLFPGSTLIVTAMVEVDDKGNFASGPFTADLEPEGQAIPDFSGIVNFSRMTFDD
jgi:hypothetical protein